jgi:pyridoxamine 5'-phosphate oxidase
VSIQDLRRNYTYGGLARSDLPQDPVQLFHQWFELVKTASLPEWFEVNAMTLSTAKAGGGTSSRIVLLKAIEGDGFHFFTNYDSAKGREISVDSRVALHFFWPMFDRQIRIEGNAEKTSAAISDNYFAARPRSSQLGASASPQSQVIQDEMQLEQWIETLDNKFSGQSVPRPANWGGYEVRPNMIEFWQGKPSRLHDRFRYDRNSDSSEWTIRRLAP